MASKSTKMKKQSLALVVLTPTTAKDQRRKAKGNLSKESVKKKKGKSSSAPVLECNTLYFAEDTGQERYNLDFALRKVMNGHWIDYTFFNAHNFEYSSKMDNLGWTSMTTIRDDVYPDLVVHFYANATKGYHCDTIKSYVKGVNITLDRSVIRKILGIGSKGEVYRENL